MAQDSPSQRDSFENIIDKLTKIEDNNAWKNWTLEEKKKLLDIYFIISKKETHIFDLIYNYHGCDSWEDIFRDYDCKYLENKTIGVEIAINEIVENIKSTKR
jgi:hypothetical protein